MYVLAEADCVGKKAHAVLSPSYCNNRGDRERSWLFYFARVGAQKMLTFMWSMTAKVGLRPAHAALMLERLSTGMRK